MDHSSDGIDQFQARVVSCPAAASAANFAGSSETSCRKGLGGVYLEYILGCLAAAFGLQLQQEVSKGRTTPAAADDMKGSSPLLVQGEPRLHKDGNPMRSYTMVAPDGTEEAPDLISFENILEVRPAPLPPLLSVSTDTATRPR